MECNNRTSSMAGAMATTAAAAEDADEVLITLSEAQRSMAIEKERMQEELRTLQLQRKLLEPKQRPLEGKVAPDEASSAAPKVQGSSPGPSHRSQQPSHRGVGRSSSPEARTRRQQRPLYDIPKAPLLGKRDSLGSPGPPVFSNDRPQLSRSQSLSPSQ